MDCSSGNCSEFSDYTYYGEVTILNLATIHMYYGEVTGLNLVTKHNYYGEVTVLN